MKHSALSSQHSDHLSWRKPQAAPSGGPDSAGRAPFPIPRDDGDGARSRRFLHAFFTFAVIYFAAHVLAAWLRGSFGGLR